MGYCVLMIRNLSLQSVNFQMKYLLYIICFHQTKFWSPPSKKKKGWRRTFSKSRQLIYAVNYLQSFYKACRETTDVHEHITYNCSLYTHLVLIQNMHIFAVCKPCSWQPRLACRDAHSPWQHSVETWWVCLCQTGTTQCWQNCSVAEAPAAWSGGWQPAGCPGSGTAPALHPEKRQGTGSTPCLR